jgi:hypothetical protein
MELFYCFENASLTQRILQYLLNRWRSHLEQTTVLFLNDRWGIRLKLDPILGSKHYQDCIAFLSENGVFYYAPPAIARALLDLDTGCSITEVMDRHKLVIVSHGIPQPQEIEHFRDHFVAGLGYCPQSLG